MASVAGQLTLTSLHASRPVPVTQFHSVDDRRAGYDGRKGVRLGRSLALRASVRASDLLFRIAEDQIVLVLPMTTIRGVPNIIERVVRLYDRPFTLGVATAPDDGIRADELLERASGPERTESSWLWSRLWPGTRYQRDCHDFPKGGSTGSLLILELEGRDTGRPLGSRDRGHRSDGSARTPGGVPPGSLSELRPDREMAVQTGRLPGGCCLDAQVNKPQNVGTSTTTRTMATSGQTSTGDGLFPGPDRHGRRWGWLQSGPCGGSLSARQPQSPGFSA